MRIISGNFKGKKITLPKDKKTRPLRDMVKESIFNLIDHSHKISTNISNTNVLDLFSGSGSFGLECISRGANNVVFVENYPEILGILKENINSLNTKKNYEVIEKDCFKIFEDNRKFQKKFNVVFIDPPYKEKKINFLIDKILENKILEDKGIIILHRHKKDDIEISRKLKILDQRSYGISKIIFGANF